MSNVDAAIEAPGINKAARDLIALAESLEADGRHAAAAEAYRAAIKNDPRAEQVLAGRSDVDTDAAFESKRAALFDVSRGVPPGYAPHFRTFDASAASGVLDSAEGRAAIRMQLESEGFVVLTNVLDQADIDQSWAHFAAFMAATAEVDVTNVNDWKTNTLGDRSLGIVGKRSAGHSALNWFLRSRPRVKAAFRAAYGVPEDEKMITSFDGFGFFRNPETDPAFQGTTESWLHVDAYDHHSARYVQGLVNLIDCTAEEDAGLVVVPRSNRPEVFNILCPQAKNAQKAVLGGGFTSLRTAHEHAIVQRGLLQHGAFRVPLPAGSLALWSSRTLHCNVGCLARPGPRRNPDQLVRRLVSYICMLPEASADEPGGARTLSELRHTMLTGGRSTTHQPDVGRWVGDAVRPEWVSAGAVVVDPALLPVGAAELL